MEKELKKALLKSLTEASEKLLNKYQEDMYDREVHNEDIQDFKSWIESNNVHQDLFEETFFQSFWNSDENEKFLSENDYVLE